LRPGFPLRFRRRRLLLGHPIPAGGLGLPHGRLTGGARRRIPDLDGVTAFRTHELRPGWALSIPRGRRCSSRTEGRAQPAPAASQRPVLAPRHQPSTGGGRFTRHRREFKQFARPVFPSPVAPGWNGSPWAFPRASHPTVTSGARRGRGQAIEHGPGTTFYDISRASNPTCSLVSCDFASHRPTR
jgi:hypothetical protein